MSRQHVYRCHILPIKCPSCSQTFESSRTFTRHLHEASHCDHSLVEADEPIKGLESLLQKIRSPKTTTDCPSEEDMWRVIYTTCFPNDPKDDTPCPYHEKDQETIYAISPNESVVSIPSAVPFVRTPESAYFGNSHRGYFEAINKTSSSIASSLAGRNCTPPTSIVSGHSQDSHADGDANDGSLADSIGEEAPTIHRPPQAFQARQQSQFSDSSQSFDKRKLRKKLRNKTMESQVLF